MMGTLPCFCQSMLENRGAAVKEYEYDPDGRHPVKICHDWYFDLINGQSLNRSVSYLIVFINYILRFVIIYLISYIGYHTQSNQT